MKSLKKPLITIGAVSALALAVSSCTSYTPIAAGAGTVGEKRGEASKVTILGWIPISGDNSMLTAAQHGGIKHVATVDQKVFTLFGLYNSVTTIVTGD